MKVNGVRFAVIGLGHFAQAAILPAFAHAKNARLVALFSQDEAKLAALCERHGVEQGLRYEQFDEFFRSGAADAVYIALPNSLHCEYTLRAARNGAHVLCEKPMAVSTAECESMIDTCAAHGRKLMIAYRLHFEKANLGAIEIIESGVLGELRLFNSVFCMQVNAGNIRTRRELGGGPLYDIGVYCINAARYLFRAEPSEVTMLANRHAEDERFREIEEQLGAVMGFDGGRLATFCVSFNAPHASRYEIIGTEGRLVVEPAYGYTTDAKHELTVDGKTTRRTFKKSDQVAAEISYFANCIVKDEVPEPSGIEGLCDVRVIEALFESARLGKTQELEPFLRARRPEPSQKHDLPPSAEPQPVRAQPPHS